MLPDRVSNPGPLTYESGALSTALRGPASKSVTLTYRSWPGVGLVLNKILDKYLSSYQI